LSLRENIKYSRNDLIKYLNNCKIGTRLLFAGNITKQPYMKDVKFRISGDLNNTDFVMKNTFWIGLYPGLTFQNLEYSTDRIKDFFKL
jgi:CDP-6-deoxy-D-xylo-4-hexulose-3-dehydrase